MSKIDLTLPSSHLSYGLKQVPEYAPWGGETLLYGCSEFSEFGITDGWMWATDRATALIEPAGTEPDLDFLTEAGKRVISIVTELPKLDDSFTFKIEDAARIGGSAITQIGSFDLDRLRDAVLWAARAGTWEETDDDATSVVVTVGTLSAGHMVKIVGRKRQAAVVGLGPIEKWMPQFDLPLAPISLQSPQEWRYRWALM